jgi:hypothetical protein
MATLPASRNGGTRLADDDARGELSPPGDTSHDLTPQARIAMRCRSRVERPSLPLSKYLQIREGFQNAGLVGRRWVALLSGITRARNYRIALAFAGD